MRCKPACACRRLRVNAFEWAKACVRACVRACVACMRTLCTFPTLCAGHACVMYCACVCVLSVCTCVLSVHHSEAAAAHS